MKDEAKLVYVVPDFPGLDMIPNFVEEYEKKAAKLLRNLHEAYIDLDGGEIPVDEMFDVNGHCVFSPVVNKDMVGLSKEEKAELRRQALKGNEK